MARTSRDAGVPTVAFDVIGTLFTLNHVWDTPGASRAALHTPWPLGVGRAGVADHLGHR